MSTIEATTYSPELELFDRDENKYFIPSPAPTLHEGIHRVCDNHSYRLEEHSFPFTLTVYFFPAGNVGLSCPGFTARYRAYVNNTGDLITSLQDGNGFYEFKWLEWDPHIRKQIKHKLRFKGHYNPSITKEQLLEMLHRSSIDSDLHKRFELLLQDGNLLIRGSLQPVLFVSYQRERFRATNGNVVSFDQAVKFAILKKENSKSTLVPLGSLPGAIVEYKEQKPDIHMRWQLYRLLVTHNGIRFYGKKGEGLNLLQRYLSKTAPSLSAEIEGFELESKFDIRTDNFPLINKVFGEMFTHFQKPQKKGHFLTPQFQVLNSQSTISTYLHKKGSPREEGKILVGLQAKYSSKQLVEQRGNVLVRREQKGTPFAFNRQRVRELIHVNELIKSGQDLRIRRAFYITSSSGRVFKISLDFNWPLPQINGAFFAQLEVEYTGRYGSPSGDTTKSNIINEIIYEIEKINQEIQDFFTSKGIQISAGRRKVDIFSTLKTKK